MVQKLLLCSLCLLGTTLAAVQVTHAGNQNVGYYVFDHYDGNDTIYRLVQSTHIPGIENQPSLPGDIPVSWGGGDSSCDSGGDQYAGPHCLFRSQQDGPKWDRLYQSEWNRQLQRNSGSGAINEVTDRITVVGRRMSMHIPVRIFLRSFGFVGSHPAFGLLRNADLPLIDDENLPECDTGDDQIDETGDLREELMEKSLQDPDNPIEHAGLFWPDGNGGYDLLEFGVEIPGGQNTACNVSFPPAESFPAPGTWPPGVIFFHTHPYSDGDRTTCGGPYVREISTDDRHALLILRNGFRDDIVGMILDKEVIMKYGNFDKTVARCK